MDSNINLTELENKILNKIHFYILKDKKVGIETIAKDCFVSKGAIIKLAKKLGFSGYSEMYYVSMSSRKYTASIDFLNVNKEAANGISETHIRMLCDLLMEYHKSKIYLDSLGICDCAMNYYLQKLLIFGFDAANCYHFEAFKTNNPGLYIFFSYSGSRSEIIEKVSVAQKNGFKVIAFTVNAESPLGKMADYTIKVMGSRSEKENYQPDLFTANLIILLEMILSEYSKKACLK